MTHRLTAAAFLLAGLAASAGAATFFDGFESYTDGASLHGVNGWKGWDNNPGAGASLVGDNTYSGANAVLVTGATDLVHEFTGVNSGQWSFSARQYVDSSACGASYFILMNTYADGHNSDWQSWSVQMKMDFSSGRVYDDLRSGSTARSIARNRWVEVRADIDLTNNTLTEYYDGQVVYTGTWTQGGNSALNLAAVDLYAGSGTSMYDNVSLALVPAPGPVALFLLGGVIARGRTRRRTGEPSPW